MPDGLAEADETSPRGVMTPIIYHNPDCGTSRNVLRVLKAAGYTPDIVEYLSAGWTKTQLIELFARAGMTPRQALREKKSPAAELGLLAPDVDDEGLLDATAPHPILVERPFVVTDKGAALCRPSEAVLALLDLWPPAPFFKEDGTLMIDAEGKVVDSAA